MDAPNISENERLNANAMCFTQNGEEWGGNEITKCFHVDTNTYKKRQPGDLQIKKMQRGRASAFGVLVPLQSNKDHTCMHTAIDTGRHKERVIYAYMF